MSVRMTQEEASAFLDQAHTGILTTLRRDGMPIALPVWFVTDEGRVYVATPAKTKKVGRVRRDDRVSFLVESGKRWAELKAVQLNGRARVVDAPDRIARVLDLLDAKYAGFRTSRAAMPARTKEHYGGGRAVLEIVPDGRVLSWDNTKLKIGEPDAASES